MALISRDQIIQEYYETEVRTKYPNVTLEQCQDVCRLPFDGIVEWIKSGLFPHVMIQYLGKILVNERRLTSRLTKLNNAKEQGKLSEEYYLHHKAILEEHLSSLKQITNKEIKRERRANSKNVIFIDDDQNEKRNQAY